MKKLLLLNIILLSTILPGLSKDNKQMMDSLKNELNSSRFRSKKDSDVVKIFCLLSDYAKFAGADEAIKYGYDALHTAESIHWPYGEGMGNWAIANGFLAKPNIDSAMYHYQTALLYYAGYNRPKPIILIYQAIADVHLGKNEFDSALAYYRKGLDMAKEAKDNEYVSNELAAIAGYYNKIGDTANELSYRRQALDIAQHQKNKELTLNRTCDVANYYFHKNHQADSLGLVYTMMALKIGEDLNNKQVASSLLIQISHVYGAFYNYPKELEYALNSLQIAKEINDTDLLSACYNELGNVYDNQENYTMSITNFSELADLNKARHNADGVAGCYVAIGQVYKDAKEYDKAKEYLSLASRVYDSIKSEAGKVQCVAFSGVIEKEQKNYIEALPKLHYGLMMLRSMNDDGNANTISNAIADCYIGVLKEQMPVNLPDSIIPGSRARLISLARQLLDSTVAYSRRNNQFDDLISEYKALADLNEIAGDYKSAYEHFKLSKAIRDSIFSQKNNLMMSQMEKNNELSAKDKEIEIESLLIARKKAEKIYYLMALGLFGMVIIIIFRSNRIQKKTNNLLSAEKQKTEQLLSEVREMNREISVKNKEITDNISYAQRIQSAILPEIDEVYRALQESFILYLPKDIVSGDFYAFAERDNRVIIIAADCTGHGVSGAFMSMIGSSLLNQIINENRITEPARILDHLNLAIIDALKQSNNETHDGMDVCICSVDLIRMDLHYAGANRPLWIVRNNELLSLKPDKYPIGGLQMARERTFTSNRFELQKGDTLYLFTDGYADQFGGGQQKKMMTKQFKDLLLSLSPKNMREQEIGLKKHFEDWKGNNEQVDDVLVIGVRV